MWQYHLLHLQLTEAETKCHFCAFSTTNERCDEDVFIERYRMRVCYAATKTGYLLLLPALDVSSILDVYIWLCRDDNLRLQCPDCQRLGEICC